MEIRPSWGDENVTNRADNCDPIFIPKIFYDLKIRQLKNEGNKNGISFFRALETFSSPHVPPLALNNLKGLFPEQGGTNLQVAVVAQKKHQDGRSKMNILNC
ncbi:Uncharacterized protein dnm_039680 [Desulfonema magnum]|uniref:Uncharacterized protein n=1 Tax=Desulfonema magnum TaxID=45655 RepID=A0A975GNM5_9BACT|nr:Uncharacterized protein dnm_039680 [Desulfonema magnum]